MVVVAVTYDSGTFRSTPSVGGDPKALTAVGEAARGSLNTIAFRWMAACWIRWDERTKGRTDFHNFLSFPNSTKG